MTGTNFDRWDTKKFNTSRQDLWEKGSATIASNCQYSLNGEGPTMLSLIYKSGFKRSQSDASRLTLERKEIVYDLFLFVFRR